MEEITAAKTEAGDEAGAHERKEEEWGSPAKLDLWEERY